MSALLLWPLFIEELALPGPVPRVPWEMSKRGYPIVAHFSPWTIKSPDGWGCFAVGVLLRSPSAAPLAFQSMKMMLFLHWCL